MRAPHAERPPSPSEQRGNARQSKTGQKLASCEADSADSRHKPAGIHILETNGESHAKSEFSLRTAKSNASVIRRRSLRAYSLVRCRLCARAERECFVFRRLVFFDLLDLRDHDLFGDAVGWAVRLQESPRPERRAGTRRCQVRRPRVSFAE